jgi:uncharacterized protein DUF3500
MTRMIDPRWEQNMSRRALLVTLAGTSITLATAVRRTAAAQSNAAVASPAAPGSGSATAGIAAAANAFLATLSPDQQQVGLFAWTDTAQKQRWSNLPSGAFQRAGLMWGDLNAEQQAALLQVMRATLSAEGYERVLGEWRADDALAAQEASNPNAGPPPGGPGGTPPGGGGPGRLMFGMKYYYFALIGAPSDSDPWQWQYGGHHVTINATIVGSNLSLTPSFIGVQPATYTDADGKTVRPLGDIEDDAFAMIDMLDASQRQTAVLGDTPIDLVLGPGQDGKTIPPAGLPAAQMNKDQQAAFRKLIGHYDGLGNAANAAARMAEIESTLHQTYLAWYGPTTPGSAAYFRVVGPTLVIEYSPQGGGGNGFGVGGAASPQHIHGIYRDPTNDYGAKYTDLTIGS